MALPNQSAIIIALLAALAALPFGIYGSITVATISLAVVFKSYFAECLQSLFEAWVQATSSKSADINVDGYSHQNITYQTKEFGQTPSDGFRQSKRSLMLSANGSYLPPHRQDGPSTGFPFMENRMNLSNSHSPFGPTRWSPPPVIGKPEIESVPSPKTRDENNDHVWQIHRAAMSKARQEGKVSKAVESRPEEHTVLPVTSVTAVGQQEVNESVALPVQRPKRPFVPETDVSSKRSRVEKYIEFTSKASKRTLDDSGSGQAKKRQFVTTPIKVDEMTASLSSSVRKPARRAALDDSYVVCKKCKRFDDESLVSESLLNGSVQEENQLTNVTMEEAPTDIGAGETEVADVTSFVTSPQIVRLKTRPTTEKIEEKVTVSQKLITSDDLKKDREIDTERCNAFKKAWRKAIGVKFIEEPEVKLITPSSSEILSVAPSFPTSQQNDTGSTQFGGQTPGVALKPVEKSTAGFSFTPISSVTTASSLPSSSSSTLSPVNFGTLTTTAQLTSVAPPSVSTTFSFGTTSTTNQPAVTATVTQTEKQATGEQPPAYPAVAKPTEEKNTVTFPAASSAVSTTSGFTATPALTATSVAVTVSGTTAGTTPPAFGQRPTAGLFNFGAVTSMPSAPVAVSTAASGLPLQSVAPVKTQGSVPTTTAISTGFSFGQPVMTQSTFGLTQEKSEASKTPATQPAAGFSFGTSASAPSLLSLTKPPAATSTTAAALPTASAGSTFSFGGPSVTAVKSTVPPSTFGAPVTTTSSSVFGNTASVFGGFGSQPASTTVSTTASLFSFGAQTTTAASAPFGSTTTTTPAFGSQPSLPTFGAGASNTGTSAFGEGTSTFGSGTFGTPAASAPTTTSTPMGGATSAPAFSFGQAATSPPAFGATAASPPAFGLTSPTPTFGQPSATPAFGAGSAPTFGQVGSTPSFGQTNSTPIFGQSTPSGGTNLNQPSGFSFGGPVLPGAPNPFSAQSATGNVNISENQRQKRLARLKAKR